MSLVFLMTKLRKMPPRRQTSETGQGETPDLSGSMNFNRISVEAMGSANRAHGADVIGGGEGPSGADRGKLSVPTPSPLYSHIDNELADNATSRTLLSSRREDQRGHYITTKLPL